MRRADIGIDTVTLPEPPGMSEILGWSALGFAVVFAILLIGAYATRES